jgi:endonuclease YncB( thermonuclease family)
MRFLRTGLFLATCAGVAVIYGQQFLTVYEDISGDNNMSSRLLSMRSKVSETSDKPKVKTKTSVEGVATVIDGNTLEIEGSRIELLKYRACSPGQVAKTPTETFDCGQWAKDGLAKIADSQQIRCVIHITDNKNVSRADCVTANSEDLGILMIRDGYGMPNRKYPASPGMQKAAAEAKEKQIGVWSFENLKKS